jgi:hypothetical protein
VASKSPDQSNELAGCWSACTLAKIPPDENPAFYDGSAIIHQLTYPYIALHDQAFTRKFHFFI